MSKRIKVTAQPSESKMQLVIKLKRFSKEETEHLTGVSNELKKTINEQPKNERITRSKSRFQASNSSCEIITGSEAKVIPSKRKLNKVQDVDSNDEKAKRAKMNDGAAQSTTKSNESNEHKRVADDEKQLNVMEYKVDDIVWAKIKGFPAWPAIIKKIKYGQRMSFEIEWFNDYRRSTVFKTQICQFFANFERFSVNFTKHIGLETAAKEALMTLAKK